MWNNCSRRQFGPCDTKGHTSLKCSGFFSPPQYHIEPRILCMLSKYLTTELHTPSFYFNIEFHKISQAGLNLTL